MPQETAAETPAVYDLKGLNCPLPVLKARKRLTDMQPGGLLWLETTDPLAVIDRAATGWSRLPPCRAATGSWSSAAPDVPLL